MMLSKGSITEMNGLVRGYKVLSRDPWVIHWIGWSGDGVSMPL